MSISRQLVSILIVSGRHELRRDELRELTTGHYSWAGANAGLFGGTNPLMESEGDVRR